MRNLIALSCIALLPVLSGCMAVAVGGAAATGVIMAEDRRTVGTFTEDQGIELKAASRIDEKVKDGHINVTSYNRTVHNELQVAGNSSLQARTNDTVLTSKVKARFLDAGKFSPLHVKVVTENGTVYLLGMVKRQEAADATEVARTTGGVRKVVRVFEYLD